MKNQKKVHGHFTSGLVTVTFPVVNVTRRVLKTVESFTKS